MSEWISVDDKLPPIDIRVLAINESSTPYVAWLNKNSRFEYSECCGCYCGVITHWMPLPQPPEVIKNARC